jgi:hypothetical protein
MFVPTEKPTQFTSAEKKKILSKDFRTIAVSTIGANANDNLIQVMLGLEILDADTMQEVIMEKMVQMTLTNLVQRLESVLGEIPVGPPPPVQLEKKELK